MTAIAPTVRHMLICEDVRRPPKNPSKVDLVGLLTSIRVAGGIAAFPFRCSFCVHVLLADGRGIGTGQVVVLNADTEEAVYLGSPHEIDCGSDPLRVLSATFRIPACPFPEPGLYWADFRYNENVLAREPLMVKV
jgi:hypothetical protein